MMKIRKNLYTLLTAVIFCFLSVTAAAAADGVIYFNDPETTVGSIVTVTMTVQSEETDLNEATVTLKYPSDSLEFISGTDASGGAGIVRVSGASDGRGTKTLSYDLRFKAAQAGTASVTLETYEVYDVSDAALNITHAGNSGITISAASQTSPDASLKTLEVSPGTLEPAFSPEISSYSVVVGLSVERLTINAQANNPNASVSVQNNYGLKEEENDVIVSVNAQDGQNSAEYHILVTKTEGGVENVLASTEAETVAAAAVQGVQLSCKGKTITILSPPADAVLPEGFRNSRITIDGQPVQGLVSEDSAEPEYFIVYGMNEEGELNFYCYDRKERTIQRWFERPQQEVGIDPLEYEAVQAQLKEATDEISRKTLLFEILAAAAAVFLCLVIYLAIRLVTLGRELKLPRPETEEPVSRKENRPVKTSVNRRNRRGEPEESVPERRRERENRSDRAQIRRNEAGFSREEEVPDATKILGTGASADGDTRILKKTPETDHLSGSERPENTDRRKRPEYTAPGGDTVVIGTKKSIPDTEFEDIDL